MVRSIVLGNRVRLSKRCKSLRNHLLTEISGAQIVCSSEIRWIQIQCTLQSADRIVHVVASEVSQPEIIGGEGIVWSKFQYLAKFIHSLRPLFQVIVIQSL